MITHAAIKQGGKVYSLPEPMRHNDVIRMMVGVCGVEPPITGEQGFLDEDRGCLEFVTREVALELAFTYGQIEGWTSNATPPQLFSEDVW